MGIEMVSMFQTKDVDDMAEKNDRKKGSSIETITSLVSTDIYRLNPFKILGLSTKATLVEAQRSAERLKTMVRLGLKDPAVLADGIGEQEIRDAIEILRDPRKRILYEIFWHDQEACESDSQSSELKGENP